MIPKFYLTTVVIVITFLFSCDNQPNKNNNTKIYERLDLYSDSIIQVRIDNISLNTINILKNWIEYQELKGR